jgi:hypothetical protein
VEQCQLAAPVHVADWLDAGHGHPRWRVSGTTEGFLRNIPIASVGLEPPGVGVHEVMDDGDLSSGDDAFDLTINRYETWHGRSWDRLPDLHKDIQDRGYIASPSHRIIHIATRRCLVIMLALYSFYGMGSGIH